MAEETALNRRVHTPEAPRTETLVPVPQPFAGYWKARERWPVTVVKSDRFLTVAGQRYSIVPNAEGGYFVYRHHPVFAVLGEVYQYGVRKALTPDLHLELGAARVALFPGTTYPAPLCYEMRSGALVHPGPCFDRHAESIVKSTKYQLNGALEVVCAVCKERIQ